MILACWKRYTLDKIDRIIPFVFFISFSFLFFIFSHEYSCALALTHEQQGDHFFENIYPGCRYGTFLNGETLQILPLRTDPYYNQIEKFPERVISLPFWYPTLHLIQQKQKQLKIA